MNNHFISDTFEEFINADIEIKFFVFSILFLSFFIYHIKSKITYQKQCPHCKKDKTYRTKQNFFELYLFQLDAHKKYKCLNCARSFFIKNAR